MKILTKKNSYLILGGVVITKWLVKDIIKSKPYSTFIEILIHVFIFLIALAFANIITFFIVSLLSKNKVSTNLNKKGHLTSGKMQKKLLLIWERSLLFSIPVVIYGSYLFIILYILSYI